ncbi:hypothetical protein BP6252_03939 [Coleophoma cylindrospora]|uniref:phosphoethanolamine N-methyltransferase n=1 Tax=Coleophoma cylindrospora TaxID=1849047 RepID=A0A3D8S8Z4_9HELO|nr:hypothetical protein BP6252_03939 [Coleophoma cylindrospora]
MSTPGALAGFETFDKLNIEYENAYKNNAFKKACIDEIIRLLPAGSKVLDVGCGTGVPVSEMLAQAGMNIVGIDISPNMIQLAKDRIEGDFTVSDMLGYEVQGEFDAILIIFSHLQLLYADFYQAAKKFAAAVKPGGILAIGQTPSDTYVDDDSHYDKDQTYVEDYDVPFMGEMLPTFMMTAEGQRKLLRSFGLDVVWEVMGTFHPDNEKCDPEEQQYTIAMRPAGP